MTGSVETSLWDFSLAHYGKSLKVDTCLQLQDNYGVNVNILLWSLWLESQNKLLTPDRLMTALSAVALWNADYVQPLRQLRRRIKQDFAADLAQVASVREQIKGAELLAEKQEQLWLEQLALNWSGVAGKIAKGQNLTLYLQYLCLPAEAIRLATIECADC